jgi:hypothetical protein
MGTHAEDVEELSHGPEKSCGEIHSCHTITAATFTSLCGYGKQTTWA